MKSQAPSPAGGCQRQLLQGHGQCSERGDRARWLQGQAAQPGPGGRPGSEAKGLAEAEERWAQKQAQAGETSESFCLSHLLLKSCAVLRAEAPTQVTQAHRVPALITEAKA